MKRLLLLFLLLPSLCFGQGAHRIGQVLVKGNGIGANVGPYAKIQVCVVNTGCASLATIYLDAALTSTAQNPVTANGSGNYDYYIASGCVDEQISSPGQGAVFLSHVCPFSGTSSSGNVTSVFGRTGVVVAQTGDYTAAQVGADASGAAAAAQAASLQKTNNLSDVNSNTSAATSVATFIKTQTGCTTAGYVWIPASNTCVAQSGGTSLIPLASIQADGTSYVAGAGSINRATESGFGYLQTATPAAQMNRGADGTTIPQIVNTLFQGFVFDPSLPSAEFIDGGPNDAVPAGCGTAPASCDYSNQNMYMAAAAWASIPYSSKILASAATASSGWSLDSTYGVYQPTSGITSPGNSLSSTTSGNTLTFSIPSTASTKVGFTYGVGNTLTGTFTVSVDGTLATNNITNSTTFSSAPGTGQNLNTATSSFYRQEVTVTPNITHTVIITHTNTSEVPIVGVDWVPNNVNPLTSNVNGVFYMNTNAGFTNYLRWNVDLAAVVTTLHADGLPVFLVNQPGGTPGVNATTDVSSSATASCPATQVGGHPMSGYGCGYWHMYQTIQNTETAGNWIFSNQLDGGKTIGSTGIVSSALQVNQTGQSNNLNTSNNVPSATVVYGGFGNAVGTAIYQDQSTSLPWSGQFVNAMVNSFTYNCTANVAGSANLTANASYTTGTCADNNGNLFTKGGVYVGGAESYFLSSAGNLSANNASYTGYALFGSSAQILIFANGVLAGVPGSTIGFNSGGVNASDTAFSRISAGIMGLGNGTASDHSAILNLGGLLGPATAPSGSCTVNGEVVISQNGVITYCNSGTWTTVGGGSSGISGATSGQALIAGSATTATSSKALAGSGAGLTTGPASGVTTTDLATFTGTGGQISDSTVPLASVTTLTGTQTLTNKTISASSVSFTSLIAGSTTFTGAQGIGANIASATGSFTTGDLVSIDANGTFIDGGAGGANITPKTISTIASATGITFTTSVVIITGTTPIQSISLPTFSGTLGGCIDVQATGAWSTITGGNIDNALTAVPPSSAASGWYRFCYGGSSWGVK